MLTLTRKVNESLVYFDGHGRELLRLTVERVSGRSVRLVSEMASDVRVMRHELLPARPGNSEEALKDAAGVAACGE